VIFIVLPVVRFLSYGRFKGTVLGWHSNYDGRLKSSWTRLIRKRDLTSPYYCESEFCGGACTHACIHTYTYTRTRTYVYVHMSRHACTHKCLHIFTHGCSKASFKLTFLELLLPVPPTAIKDHFACALITLQVICFIYNSLNTSWTLSNIVHSKYNKSWRAVRLTSIPNG
jgi:hypothetical protein